MKNFALLFAAALTLGGCSGERAFTGDEPLPSAAEVEGQIIANDAPPAEEPPPAAGSNASGAAANDAQSKPWSQTQTAPAKPDPSQTKYPVAKTVAGKTGIVRSPYAPYAGDVDVRGFSPGQQVKCPYTGKIFIVP